ncbi:virulence factor MviN [Acidobacteria bacterium AB60]|nr:virulence factor MviN [Acidobacteria bacterium AB60]
MIESSPQGTPRPEQGRLDAVRPEAAPAPGSRWTRVLQTLRPSHAHSAFTATVFLMAFQLLSRIIGLVRGKYIAAAFGAGPQTDAYAAAFGLPELTNYFLAGGAASITFVTLLNRYRERGQEEEGERVLSIVLNFIVLVLTVGVIAGMFLAEPYIRRFNPGFTPAQVALSAHMTRILLPGQIFFFAGGVLGATLLVRRQFMYQGLQGILYNAGIIFGGVLLARRMGISSLAVGALSGAFLGAFVLNAVGAWKAGVRYRVGIDFRHPGLREWAVMTLPLMAGFTLTFFDDYFVRYFASHSAGDITRLMNAKQLFSAPMAVLAQAAGAASMPFFARLWAQNKFYEFATGVADSVSRVVSLGMLAASGMIALAYPLVHVIFAGGRFKLEDVRLTAIYFALYTLALVFWSAQAIYVRAFYAAGITWMPMVAGAVVTVVAFPIYAAGFRWHGAEGLALASDMGIGLQTVTLALLLHQRRMVSLASLDYREMGRCLAAGLAAGVAVWAVFIGLLGAAAHQLGWEIGSSRGWDLVVLAVGTVSWLGIAVWVLEKSGSALPRVARRRLRLS